MVVLWPLGGASCDLDIGEGEIVALEQEWLPGRFCKGVGEAVSKIQASRMIAPTKALPSKAGCLAEASDPFPPRRVCAPPGPTAIAASINRNAFRTASSEHHVLNARTATMR